MSRKRSFISGIYKEKNKKLCTLGVTGDGGHGTDTRAALSLLKSLFPVEKFQRHLPPIVMKHQIYAFIADRTEVDKQLNDMRKNGEIRLFKLGSSQEELAIVFVEDYIRYIHQTCGKNSVVGAFINYVVKNSPDISFSKDVLMGQYLLKEDNIRELVQQGLLTARDVGCYWLSIPQVGEFVKTFLYGRRATLQYVRRTKYKEILQSELEQRKLPRKAILGVSYHIYDLIGSDLVKCIETSTGRMLRLQPESQSS